MVKKLQMVHEGRVALRLCCSSIGRQMGQAFGLLSPQALVLAHHDSPVINLHSTLSACRAHALAQSVVLHQACQCLSAGLHIHGHLQMRMGNVMVVVESAVFIGLAAGLGCSRHPDLQGGNQEAIHPVAQRFAVTVPIRRNNWQATGHGFERCQTKSLLDVVGQGHEYI